MTTQKPRGAAPIMYQVQLPVSTRTLQVVSDLVSARRKKIGSRWRKAPPGKQAIIALAVLRHDQRLLDMAGGNGVSASTIRRWVLEVIDLLAARAPRLDRVLATTVRTGGEVVLAEPGRRASPPPAKTSAGHRAGEGLPSSRRHYLNVPRPIRRAVPHGCNPGTTPLPWPSPRFRRARHPLPPPSRAA
ncbi:transposase family protein [Saccharopolyspora phatthalungensis]|uniref:Transposase Helix-turn-helix domain-containing protein n=1 Tax=Saccharopolyspora phatthalungensis TaxID=664693 RepID=A0A840Q6V0_9PSEU|nr:transposase family protein [Saccharopolyspora phatthalungensis]MBB5155610.1 hypothetical protein [Saccharopolyspora phatthalungensis]